MPVNNLLPLTDAERDEILAALAAVPVQTKTYHAWTSPEGVAALARVSEQVRRSGWPHMARALFPDAEAPLDEVDFLRSALLYQRKRRRGR